MYQKEIIETHHNNKISSPSGTSLTLANLLDTENITSIRIGDVVGTHEIILERANEIISINHIVNNRKVYAIGAVNSASWLIDKKPGLYSFGDMYE
jgi:4-hydroxy-tetrahydrodipicolinate reductase